MKASFLASAALSMLLAACVFAADAPKTAAAFMQPYLDRQEIAGAVLLVADKDKVLCLEAAGYADIAAKKPMAADSVFWIASMTKSMTGAALMMLVDEGKLKLDDPVEKFLPEFKGMMFVAERDDSHALLKKPSLPVTIRNLMCHTAGMAFKSPLEEPALDSLSLRENVRIYSLIPLQWEPGSKYAYSNEDINTAGRIIEVVSKMPYEDFMQKRLFDPLGMKDTTFWPSEEQLQRLAKPYKPNAAKNGLEETRIYALSYPLSDRKRHPVPAGGLFSTASDAAKFCQMALAGGVFEGRRLLSEESVKAMTSKQTPEGVKDNYGVGWGVWGNGLGFGHGGAFGTDMSVDISKGLLGVFLIQNSGYFGEGSKCCGEFKSWAVGQYGKKQP